MLNHNSLIFCLKTLVYEVFLKKNNCLILVSVLKRGRVFFSNLIEKGISTITLESKFIIGIKKYFSDIKFDLVMYSTPPITLQKAVNYVKKRDKQCCHSL